MCHGWKCIFGDPPLRSSLNCEELTRQGFLKELRRSGCILVALRIGSRAHWACSRQHRCKLRRQKTIDLTDTLLEHQRKWWNGDSENNWLTFEAELFSSLIRVGTQGGLETLISLDLGFVQSRGKIWGEEQEDSHSKDVAMVTRKRVLALRDSCPHLQHFCLLAHMTDFVALLLPWRTLRSFSLGSTGDWQDPTIRHEDLPSGCWTSVESVEKTVGEGEGEDVNSTCSLYTLMSLCGPPQSLAGCDEAILSGAEQATCSQALAAAVPGIDGVDYDLTGEDGTGKYALVLRQFNGSLGRGGIFRILRRLCVVVSWGSDGPNLEISPERFPELESLEVCFMSSNGGSRGMCVQRAKLRKLSLVTAAKCNGGIRALVAPQVEVLVYRGGGTPYINYSQVCCQIGRALVEDPNEYSSLKAFRWDTD